MNESLLVVWMTLASGSGFLDDFAKQLSMRQKEAAIAAYKKEEEKRKQRQHIQQNRFFDNENNGYNKNNRNDVKRINQPCKQVK